MPDATWRVGQLSTFNLPPALFMDVNGDIVAFSGTLDRATLPPWMQIHDDDGSVHGRPVTAGKQTPAARDRKRSEIWQRLRRADSENGCRWSGIAQPSEGRFRLVMTWHV